MTAQEVLQQRRRRLALGPLVQVLHDVAEARQRRLRPVGDALRVRRDFPPGLAGFPDRRGELVEGRGADAAGGHVDDAAEREIVLGPGRELQVGEDVLDLRALVELHAADDDVGDLPADHLFLEGPRLGVGAVEDRGLPRRPSRALDLASHGFDFGAIFFEPPEPDGVSVAAIGPQPLLAPPAVVRDDAGSRRQDLRRRPIVRFESDDPGPREILFEAEDVLDLGAAPAIDGLVLVADRAEGIGLHAEELDERVLRRVGVLVFVDQQVPQAPALLGRDGRAGGEEPHRAADQSRRSREPPTPRASSRRGHRSGRSARRQSPSAGR